MLRFASSWVCFALLLTAGAARAATFTVTRTDDPPPGACDGDCSLREAIRAANTAGGADTVVMPAGTYTLSIVGPDELAGVGDLDIQGPVTISGAGAASTIINGAALGRIFHVDPEGDGNIAVTMSGITVRNGADNFGGAILSLANLTLDGVIVSDSIADLGGGIYALRPTVLLNSTIRGNSTRANGFGGGMRADNTTITMQGTTFAQNTAERDGAGLYLFNTGGTISGSTFSDNVSALGAGGAIEAFGVPSILTINAAFTNNRANDGGAVTLLEGPNFTFTGSTFSGNIANGTDFNGGGALFLFNARATFNGGSLAGNTAFGEGGGAILAGGGTGGSVVTISGASFEQNRAETHGGPLPGSNPGLGGALLVISGSRVDATAARFETNTAALAGGAIYVDRDVTATIDATQFLGNRADQQFGGAISSEGTVILRGSTLRTNQAGIAGGAIASGFAALTIEDSAIDGNTAPSAGAIWNTFTSALVVRRTGFSGNIASGNTPSNGFGGAIMLENGPGTTMPEAKIENVTFSGNSGREGGALTLAGTNATSAALVHTTFSGNTASVSGSAIRLGPLGTARIKSSIVAGTCGLQGALTSGGRNIESLGNTCGFAATGDASSTPAATLALQAAACNGGVSRTHGLAAASIARDRVPAASCTNFDGVLVATDQRGIARPQDGNANGVADCDSGAFEAVGAAGGDLLFANGFEDAASGSTGAVCL